MANYGDVRQFREKTPKWAKLGLTVRRLVFAYRRAEDGRGHVGKNGWEKRRS
jgi:hypothetical protein